MDSAAETNGSETVVHVRMPGDLVAYLRETAEREHRTVGGQVRKLVAEARDRQLEEVPA